MNTEAYLNDQAEFIPYNRDFEIDRSLFKLTNKIGEGQFGNVFKGELKMNEKDPGRLVAVKAPGGKSDSAVYE